MENVAICNSPGKGRGLKATKEMWAGDVIFCEPSIAAVVFDRYSGSRGCVYCVMVEDVQMSSNNGGIWKLDCKFFTFPLKLQLIHSTFPN